MPVPGPDGVERGAGDDPDQRGAGVGMDAVRGRPNSGTATVAEALTGTVTVRSNPAVRLVQVEATTPRTVSIDALT